MMMIMEENMSMIDLNSESEGTESIMMKIKHENFIVCCQIRLEFHSMGVVIGSLVYGRRTCWINGVIYIYIKSVGWVIALKRANINRKCVLQSSHLYRHTSRTPNDFGGMYLLPRYKKQINYKKTLAKRIRDLIINDVSRTVYLVPSSSP